MNAEAVLRKAGSVATLFAPGDAGEGKSHRGAPAARCVDFRGNHWGIVGILVYESTSFFVQISLWEFLTDRQWTPLFSEPHYGILPLVSGPS